MPVNEALPRPGARHAQRIVLEREPGAAPGYAAVAAAAAIEAHRDALVGDVGVGGHVVERASGRSLRLPVGRIRHFERADQKIAVVHLLPWLALDGRGPTVGPLRQPVEIRAGDLEPLARIVWPEKIFPDVVDDVVFLLRHELHLRHHQPPAAGQRLVHRVRIIAVLENPLGKAQ